MTEKHIYVFYKILGKENYRNRRLIGLFQGLMGRMELAVKGYEDFFFGNINVLKCDCGGSFWQVLFCFVYKKLNCLKIVNFIVSKLFFEKDDF